MFFNILFTVLKYLNLKQRLNNVYDRDIYIDILNDTTIRQQQHTEVIKSNTSGRNLQPHKRRHFKLRSNKLYKKVYKEDLYGQTEIKK